MRKFNTTGLCVPSKHYMVDISSRTAQIRTMVDAGDYFCINRPRQYGKTTMIAALRRSLIGVYDIVSMDFQALSQVDFSTEALFVRSFCRLIVRMVRKPNIPSAARTIFEELAKGNVSNSLSDPFWGFSEWCAHAERPVVLIVDEVDSATNNQVFLDFLSQLRLQFLNHEDDPSSPAFKSVILAGVTDVRHLRTKIRPEEQHRVNSPWNIATKFTVDMSFSVDDVEGMLANYESDHRMGMDVADVAGEIVSWTNGYPYLVSWLCQAIDEGGLSWNRDGVHTAVKQLLKDGEVSLFASLMGNLTNYPELAEQLNALLMRGEEIIYLPYDEAQQQLRMYGFVTERNGRIEVSNRIFESLLYDHFLHANKNHKDFLLAAGEGRSAFVEGGSLDMCAVLEGFRRTYAEVFGPLEAGERFREKDGRELFLLYLEPIINGTGNFYIEAQTRDQTRTDVVVDYAGKRYVIELKIWRGQRYHERGERQIADYLAYFDLSVGYMLSFNFNKHKEPGLRRVVVGDRMLFEETL